ncbi:MAG TPA: replication-relaxation family protein [Candidatus Scatovicinus merdipullorum]|nr:replication-relaxation family protein [Candidatus Scatovicinus merdipullorum]
MLRQLDRWRFCLSRHMLYLGDFSSQRTTDRRLKLLREAGYIQRRKILYGVPYLYSLTYQGKVLIHTSLKKEKIRIEKITHDISVLDTAIYFMLKYGVKQENLLTEKELHRIDGFCTRKHQPDFIIQNQDKKTCIEIELTLKAKNRLEKTIQENFLNYDDQKWIVPNTQIRMKNILQENSFVYPLEIIDLEGVVNYVRNGSKSES